MAPDEFEKSVRMDLTPLAVGSAGHLGSVSQSFGTGNSVATRPVTLPARVRQVVQRALASEQRSRESTVGLVSRTLLT